MRIIGSVDSRGKPRIQTDGFGETRTVQSDAHKADIQNIISKFNATGIIEHLNTVEMTFADVSEFGDYKDVMDHLRMAETEFMKLPSKVREEFDHDVANWLDAAHDPARDEPPAPEPAPETPPDPVPDPTPAE